MLLDRFAAGRLFELLESHQKELCDLCNKLKDGEYDHHAVILGAGDSELVEEAIDWLHKAGFQPAADRLQRLFKNLLMRRTDEMFCELARHQSPSEVEWLRNRVGPFPEPGNDDAEHEDMKRDRMLAMLGYACKYFDFLQGLLDHMRASLSSAPQGCEAEVGTVSSLGSPDTSPISPICSEPMVTHSDDFTSVVWFGTRYTFAKGQPAEAVRVLWKAWEDGGHSLSQETIGERIESSAGRFELAKVFRSKKTDGTYEAHPAWRTMIQSRSKGTYLLVPPESA